MPSFGLPGSALTINSFIPVLLCLCYYAAWPSLTNVALVLAFTFIKNKSLVGSALDELLRRWHIADILSWELIAGSAVLTLTTWTTRHLLRTPASSTWKGPSKPLLFPCLTTHTRTFPKKHSFSYSYLVVGIPVGWTGAAGGLISTGSDISSGWLSRSWYHIDASDYLERGDGHLGLRGKLDAYLSTQGVDPASFPHAYLVTAAKFLGYQFNPVSFWYLYDDDRELAAMILEVNNTFDERRMYFLPASESDRGHRIANGTTTAPNGATATDLPTRRLTKAWPKDFHVSPFNSRKGSYSLNAIDVLGPRMQGPGDINNTVVLRSSKNHGKLVAKIFSEGPSLDPAEMSLCQRLVFLARWWWVGFATFPRIVQEAGVLFFARKLHVWFRPEPLKESIGRNADATERQLEAFFRRYLRYVVEHTTAPLAVKYVPSGLPGANNELMESPSAQGGQREVEEVEFRVLTPVFYSRFVFYAHDLEAMFCELRESSTLWISHPELLPKLFLQKPPSPVETASYRDFLRFKAIQRLRHRPQRIERPLTSSQTSTQIMAKTEDIRGFRISAMDGFVLSSHDVPMRRAYGEVVLKLFLAERLAFGLIPLLDIQRLILQSAAAWALAQYLDTTVKTALGLIR